MMMISIITRPGAFRMKTPQKRVVKQTGLDDNFCPA